MLLYACRRIDALTRDYGVVCHTARVAYHTVKCLSPTVPELPDLTVVAEELVRRVAGRFWLVPIRERVRARTGLRLELDRGEDLRYVDREMLGKLYLLPPDALDEIPGWPEMGPDADDPELTLEAFRTRIRRHPGELKPLLRSSRFVAGIGNAYSDEILWEARLAPFRKRSTLKPEEIDRLYDAMRRVLADAVERLRELVPPEIQTQHREFLKVHLRGGEPCPRCGRELRQIGGREATTFCRTCQPPF